MLPSCISQARGNSCRHAAPSSGTEDAQGCLGHLMSPAEASLQALTVRPVVRGHQSLNPGLTVRPPLPAPRGPSPGAVGSVLPPWGLRLPDGRQRPGLVACSLEAVGGASSTKYLARVWQLEGGKPAAAEHGEGWGWGGGRAVSPSACLQGRTHSAGRCPSPAPLAHRHVFRASGSQTSAVCQGLGKENKIIKKNSCYRA